MHIFRSPLRLRWVSACLVAALFLFATIHVLSQTPAATTTVDLAAAMDSYAAPLYNPIEPGAAVIVVKDGKTIFRKGYGLANMELNIPVKPEMVFRLASVTKQFTAVATIMLVDQGKLRLDDEITKYLTDYPAVGNRIKIENLLTHTSGIEDYIEKFWPNTMREDLKPERLINTFKNDPLEFEPGARDSYSNSNYVLLGRIIEKISGKTYRQFVEDNIFKPLAMTHSYYEENQDLIPNRASGYLNYKGVLVNAPYMSAQQLYAAGALYSSVDDLALWDAAVYSDKLLKHESWERLFTPYRLANGRTSVYAYGWAIGQFQGRVAESHGGGLPGSRAWVLRLPQDHVYVAILSNDSTAETQPETVANRLAAIAIGKPIADLKIIELDAAKLDAFAVQYKSGDDIFTVRRQGDKLIGASIGNPDVELFPVSMDKFIIKSYDAKVSFVRDGQGNLTGISIDFMGQPQNYRKTR